MTDRTAAEQLGARPDDTVIAAFTDHTIGVTHRIAADGRYTVEGPDGEARKRPPRSYYERGAQRVSATGLERLRTALRKAGFFELPKRVEAPVSVAQPHELAFGARGTRGWHEVRVTASIENVISLGPLNPIFTAFDREVIGEWARE